MTTPIPLPDAPFLVLDLDIFERNLARIHRTIVTEGGKRWRPHVKAVRSPELAVRLQEAGAQGVTCATVGEAEALVAGGIRDVLIASQVVAPGALQRLARLNQHAQVITSVDAPAQVAALAAAARDAGVVLPVVLEVDIGMHRCGVAPGAAAVELASHIHRTQPALRFCGLMAWEGHTTGIADPVAKTAAITASVAQLTDTARQCVAAGVPVEIVSCGGTGTYPVTALLPGVTEVQAGGGVFGDRRYRTEFRIDLEQALTLRATVLSRPNPRRIVCNAGWRYLAAWPTPASAVGLPGAVRLSPSAEHLTLDSDQDLPAPAIGDPLSLEVGYADATVFLHPAIYTQRAGVIGGRVRIPPRD